MPVAFGAAVPHVRSPEGADDFHAAPGPGDGDVEPPLASLAGEGAKVHVQLAVCVGSVSDAEDDDVALIALDGFEVLDEEAVQSVVVLQQPCERRFALYTLLNGVENRIRLCRGEGDDPERQSRIVCAVFDDPIHHAFGLDGVPGPGAALVHAVHKLVVDAQVERLLHGTREGVELAVVEPVVRVGDEVLVQAAIVPGKRQRGDGAGRLAKVQDAAERVGCVLAVGLVDRSGEEGCGRELLLVSGHDELAPPVNAVHGVGRHNLGRLVENDHVKTHVAGQVLRH